MLLPRLREDGLLDGVRGMAEGPDAIDPGGWAAREGWVGGMGRIGAGAASVLRGLGSVFT